MHQIQLRTPVLGTINMLIRQLPDPPFRVGQEVAVTNVKIVGNNTRFLCIGDTWLAEERVTLQKDQEALLRSQIGS
ncbi:MAG: hypothetical protein HYW51_01340 [Candidatus Doudnabacteria bacterium]|nr:hypothetical protein [Candidatus Doudnabacteria bacterium]